MKQPYSIGLDIGTNSVGWAVINESFDLRKYKHQNMWGAHLFDEAQKAATRRSFRSIFACLNQCFTLATKTPH